MRICNLKINDEPRLGIQHKGRVVDLVQSCENSGIELDWKSIDATLTDWISASDQIKKALSKCADAGKLALVGDNPIFLPPVRRPGTFRDFYAFEEHVRNARKLRGLDIAPEWFEFPVFYFSNPNTIKGPEDAIRFPRESIKCDIELEVGAVLGGSGSDLSPDEGEKLIAGYTILNDWTARDIQRKEMAVSLGPAKGKDFATSIGPWLVTPDELEDRRSGKGYNLTMGARINGKTISNGNWKTIHYSFGEMIARASAAAGVFAGDLFGSGTVGRGCLLEQGLDHDLWLKPGDKVELEIERLGILRNEII